MFVSVQLIQTSLTNHPGESDVPNADHPTSTARAGAAHIHSAKAANNTARLIAPPAAARPAR